MTIDGKYDDSNIFSLIINGEEACFPIFENDDYLAFLDIFPQSKGHTLVIPKKIRARNIFDFPSSSLGEYFSVIQHVGKILVESLRPEGIEIQQFNGAAAGQTVYHVHFHLIPRYEGIDIIPHNKTIRADNSELKKLRKLLHPKIPKI